MQILEAAYLWLKIAFMAIITVLMVSAWKNPDAVGHWMAQKDIAYDSIWSEWIMDCDCTEPLE